MTQATHSVEVFFCYPAALGFHHPTCAAQANNVSDHLRPSEAALPCGALDIGK
jgi:hypothetical protein